MASIVRVKFIQNNVKSSGWFFHKTNEESTFQSIYDALIAGENPCFRDQPPKDMAVKRLVITKGQGEVQTPLYFHVRVWLNLDMLFSPSTCCANLVFLVVPLFYTWSEFLCNIAYCVLLAQRIQESKVKLKAVVYFFHVFIT